MEGMAPAFVGLYVCMFVLSEFILIKYFTRISHNKTGGLKMKLSQHLTEALFQLSKHYDFHELCEFPIKCSMCTARIEINMVRMKLKDLEENTNITKNYIDLD
jgi:hypothetical protein